MFIDEYLPNNFRQKTESRIVNDFFLKDSDIIDVLFLGIYISQSKKTQLLKALML